MKDALIEQISGSLNSIKGKCQLKDRTIAVELKISCSELNCMKQFLVNNNLSVKDIAEKLGITSGGVTKIVSQLEEQSLLRRDMDPDDRRGIIVSLTPRGEKLIADLKKRTTGYYDMLFKSLSKAEKEEILKGLQLLNESWVKLTGVKSTGVENC